MPPETLGHRHLRRHAEADRCCGKSLIGSALRRFRVRQHARRELISKRAPSTTRTSLRLRISNLRAVRERLPHTPPSSAGLPPSGFLSAVYTRHVRASRGNCVRPANVARTGWSWGNDRVTAGPRHLQFPDRTAARLGASCSRFALGFFAATVRLPLPPIWAGIVVGLLTSTPDAVITKTYAPILGTGVLFGVVCRWAVERWGAHFMTSKRRVGRCGRFPTAARVNPPCRAQETCLGIGLDGKHS
jgi:hypothetical protein